MLVERLAAQVVDLHGHEARGELDDVGLDAQLVQRVGRLQPEQAAADHGADLRLLRGIADRLEVLDRPVDEHVAEVGAGHGRHERRRAGGEHQLVVVQVLARRQRHDPVPRRDRDDLGAQPQRDPRVVVPPRGQEAERVGARLEERGQRHAVVRRPRLLTDDGDVVGLGEAARDRGLHELVADHAVADDDELLAEVRCHHLIPSRADRSARSWRTVEAQPPHPVVARVVSRACS